MSCEAQSYPGVHKKVFDCLKQQLDAMGYGISGISGKIEGPMGISIQYNWDEAASVLNVQVMTKNFFIPCSQIYKELGKAINACGGAIV